jgi:uncharacterized protein YidB (DUF937 family)
MGLLDNLSGLAQSVGGAQDPATNPRGALVQAVLGMLVHGNEPGGLGGSGGIGGLGGLVQRFESAGLGPQVASWIGTGQNLPISADQLKAALSGGPLHALAEQFGMDPDQVASHLSGVLPEVVDKLTPGGQVPAAGMPEGGIAGALSSLGHLFGPSPA